ncbi:LD-carboxypeptidase [Marivirga lumbricoides]|uniref:LD-carboxypeptidase n=1 Tax=Marivirga lumbricoides TaxID=1046115 RepID=A0A2T4DDU5_9BACT|nr:LD-carboxypeptidase [Marivirga lumbricoides]
MIQLPTFLKAGDLILVVSPSGVVNEAAVQEGIFLLRTAGFKVELASNVFAKHYKFAGTEIQRLADLQYAMDHSEAKAIFCARGGFGITHIIDQLNWEKFQQNAKWIIGFSDITALLHAAYIQGFASIHASVVQGLSKLNSANKEAVIKTLKGDFSILTALSKFNKAGEAQGDLIGGNLSLLVHQLGSATEIDYKDRILFVEEVAEPLYHVDRMLLQLKRAGKLQYLRGLVVGQFTNTSESKELYGESVEEIILKHCSDYSFPVGFNFPFGHGDENVPLMHGGNVKLTVAMGKSSLLFSNTNDHLPT